MLQALTGEIGHRGLRKQRQRKGFSEAYSLVGEIDIQKIMWVAWKEWESRGQCALWEPSAVWGVGMTTEGCFFGGVVLLSARLLCCAHSPSSVNVGWLLVAALISQFSLWNNRFLSTPGRTAQGQMLLSADFIGLTKLGLWKDGWMRRRGSGFSSRPYHMPLVQWSDNALPLSGLHFLLFKNAEVGGVHLEDLFQLWDIFSEV